MQFAARPENDFAQFIRTYYDECRSRFDGIEAIAGKWMFRDLIPGMSDFDTRFIVRDGMTADDWSRMSMAVGETHHALCLRYPCWARNLEHLPGINLTWSELVDERTYYPEYQQWSFYHSEQPKQVSQALAHFTARAWDMKDEYFHLKKFCLYYGRYNRTIDPAVNLGVHENKYPLHSRIMHYFVPPVHSAMCIFNRRNIVGKLDALEMAARLFPELRCWEIIRQILHANYETYFWYDEPAISDFDDALEEALAAIAARLGEELELVPAEARGSVAAWKQALQSIPVDPALVVFDNAKFSRLMKGRLWFYTHAPAHFDSRWLIENELRRIGQNFFVVPFRTYWKIRSGEVVENPVTMLDSLCGNTLDSGEVAAVKEFHRLTQEYRNDGSDREVALAIIDIFDGFFSALHKISLEVIQETSVR